MLRRIALLARQRQEGARSARPSDAALALRSEIALHDAASADGVLAPGGDELVRQLARLAVFTVNTGVDLQQRRSCCRSAPWLSDCLRAQ
jgi:hypothetical protein